MRFFLLLFVTFTGFTFSNYFTFKYASRIAASVINDDKRQFEFALFV